MKKLLKGIVEFKKGLTQDQKAFFEKLSDAQTPDTLFIACSDSRVVPNQFASTNPGDLFVLRNIGNIMPPADSKIDFSASSALEYSVLTLGVSDIIVCGHSECGAMKTLAYGTNDDSCPLLSQWLKYAKNSLSQPRDDLITDVNLSQHDRMSQINVLQQIDNIKTYSFVQSALMTNQLQIHGWWFDIAKANVYCYEASQKRFILIDENEANEILNRLH